LLCGFFSEQLSTLAAFSFATAQGRGAFSDVVPFSFSMSHPALISASLIISAGDSADALALVLDSLLRQTRLPHEVIIADRVHSEHIAALASKMSHRLLIPVHLVRTVAGSPSRASVLNQAIRTASGEYLIFTDGDCLFNRHFIADHLRHAAPGSAVQGRRAGIRSRYVRRVSLEVFQPVVWFMRRRIYGLRQGIRRPWAAIRRNDFRAIHGCNFALWRTDALAVNGFDETFDESGREFVEMVERLRNSGTIIRTVTGQAIVYHLDHHRTARYRTRLSDEILERTRREKRVRCEHGVVSNAVTIGSAPVLRIASSPTAA
jgi:glycosyltransferase involved in cell wall biosynthesis